MYKALVQSELILNFLIRPSLNHTKYFWGGPMAVCREEALGEILNE
jgi:hypothetical protein